MSIIDYEGQQYEVLGEYDQRDSKNRFVARSILLLKRKQDENIFLEKTNRNGLPMRDSAFSPPQKYETFLKSRTLYPSEKASGRLSKLGVKTHIGRPIGVMTPTRSVGDKSYMQTAKSSVVRVALDAEWGYYDTAKTVGVESWQRRLLSQQYAWVVDGSVYVWVLFTNGKRFALSTVLSWLFEMMAKTGLYEVGGAAKVPLELCTFYGIVDLTTFWGRSELLRRVDSVRRTLVSIEKPFAVDVWDRGRNRRRRVILTLRDMQLLAPGGSNLETLGVALGMPKLDLPPGYDKGDMERLLVERRDAFMAYAAQDAVITLLWGYAMYDKLELPISIGSEAAKRVREHIMQARGWKKADEFDRGWRGYHKVVSGTYKDKRGRVRKTYRIESLPHAIVAHSLATHAFYGGRNECFLVGPWRGPWFDYDLAGAYPSAMALLPDIDYTIEPSTITGRVPRLTNPVEYLFGLVRFKFPDDTPFPCLPVRDDSGAGLIFPIEGKTFASGPEIWLAQRMGAELVFEGPAVWMQVAPHFSLGRSVKSLVMDRIQAAAAYGKKSPQELRYKEGANSVYGKLAQGLVNRRGWSTRDMVVKDMPPSVITAPPQACLTTALVRATVSAVMHQLARQGYRVGSVTTDGFLTNAPIEVLQGCEGFGLIPLMREGRQTVAGKTDVWETKHTANAIIFMRTRGQIGLGEGHTPIARAGFKAPSDKKNDPAYLSALYEAREGYLAFEDKTMPSPRDYSIHGADGTVKPIIRRVSWEFDLKREVLEHTAHMAMIEGLQSAHVAYETRPWRHIEDFKAARQAVYGRDEYESIKTERDLEHRQALVRIDREARRTKRVTAARKGGVRRTWAISVLRGLRHGKLSAPWFDESMPGKEVLKRVGDVFNVPLSVNDWKMAGKKERGSMILDGAAYYLAQLKLTVRAL